MGVERSHLTFPRRQTFHGAWLIVKAENGGYLLGIDGGREKRVFWKDSRYMPKIGQCLPQKPKFRCFRLHDVMCDTCEGWFPF
jgi:hypothetical protein